MTDPDTTSRVPAPKASYAGGGTDHDWPEDFAHENGRYLCRCCKCEKQFVGHKRRVLCKVCATSRVPSPVGDDLASDTECPQCRKAWDAAKAEYEAGGSPQSPPAFCTHTHDIAWDTLRSRLAPDTAARQNDPIVQMVRDEEASRAVMSATQTRKALVWLYEHPKAELDVPQWVKDAVTDAARIVPYTERESSDGWDEVEGIRQAIEPVLDWFQSDEHEPRPTLDILRDVVAELQSDRADNLRMSAALRLCLEAFKKHDRWCGNKADAPGDGIINRARDAAREALESAAARQPIADATGRGDEDNRKLRRLLALTYSGPAKLYGDDGELYDSSMFPNIDYVRDSVDEIQRKIAERGVKAALAPGKDATR